MHDCLSIYTYIINNAFINDGILKKNLVNIEVEKRKLINH